MNNLTAIESRSTDLAEHFNVSTQALVFDPDTINNMMRMAEMMAKAVVTVPRHLAGKPSDCLAVLFQAAQWKMNPFAVAQKTHMTQSGQLGYEAQLVNAVVTSLAPIRHRVDFEFIGDWSRILGRVKEMAGKTGGKYYAQDWSKADEAGLGVRAFATLKGESEPRTIEVMLSQCWPRFSTQWATDPQQQITYVAVRKWARRYTPDVLLGVYTPDELEQTERDMGQAEVVRDPEPPAASRTETVKARLAKGRGKPQDKPPEPAVTLDSILAAIEAATDNAALKAAGAEGAKLADAGEQEQARKVYRARVAALKQATEQPQEPDAEPEPADTQQPSEIEQALEQLQASGTWDGDPASLPEVAAELDRAAASTHASAQRADDSRSRSEDEGRARGYAARAALIRRAGGGPCQSTAE